MKMNSIRWRDRFLICVIWISSCYACSIQNREQPKNIVFILVDDLGYTDVGYMHNKPKLQTPNINALAKSGTIFTNAYAAGPVCSPTRASILTGKSPAALQLTCHIPGMGMEKYLTRRNQGRKLREAKFIDHLPLKETTFAEVFQNQGYKTAFIGKWHLGGEGSQTTTDGVVNPNFHPDKQGFDVNIGGCAYGEPASYFSPYKNATISNGVKNEYLTDRLGDEACRFIEKNKKDPFLLYLSFYTVHTPWQVPKEIVEKYNGDRYYAMIDQLDKNVGKVLDKLNELGLTKNTLVVFYSDNGGTQNNFPLRDRKGSLYEGGIRVPLIFSLPGTIPQQATCDVPVNSPDFFPTLLGATGLLSESDVKEQEGINIWPVITQDEKINTRTMFWHYPHHRNNAKSMAAAIRKGDWKLIYEFESEKLSLFNLKEDLGEEENLIKLYPDKADSLFTKLKNWQAKVKASMPEKNPEYSAVENNEE